MSDLFIHRGATYARDGALRMTLTREIGPGPTLCWIGHNPSTATHEVDDPTVRAWLHYSRQAGAGRFVAVNLYPFRSTDPAACRSWADWRNNGPDCYARDDLHHNVDIVAAAAKAADKVIACWGELARDMDWVEHVIEAIQEGPSPWPDIWCLGLTGSGAPKHPMARGRHRIPRDQEFILWRAAGVAGRG